MRISTICLTALVPFTLTTQAAFLEEIGHHHHHHRLPFHPQDDTDNDGYDTEDQPTPIPGPNFTVWTPEGSSPTASPPDTYNIVQAYLQGVKTYVAQSLPNNKGRAVPEATLRKDEPFGLICWTNKDTIGMQGDNRWGRLEGYITWIPLAYTNYADGHLAQCAGG